MLSSDSGGDCALRARVEVLERQVKSLRQAQQRYDEYTDTVTSALWKRLWWWVGGYYFRKVGRWYPYATRAYRAWLVICKWSGLPE